MRGADDQVFLARSKVWVCRDRDKGRKGKGCKGRNVREEELLAVDGERIVVRKDGLDVS